MQKLIKNVRVLHRCMEPGDFILVFMYAFVGAFAIESHTVMSLTYIAVGVVHVVHIARESREKKDVPENGARMDKTV